MINQMAKVLEEFNGHPSEDDDKFDQIELLEGAAGYQDQANYDEMLDDREEMLDEYEVKDGL